PPVPPPGGRPRGYGRPPLFSRPAAPRSSTRLPELPGNDLPFPGRERRRAPGVSTDRVGLFPTPAPDHQKYHRERAALWAPEPLLAGPFQGGRGHCPRVLQPGRDPGVSQVPDAPARTRVLPSPPSVKLAPFLQQRRSNPGVQP